MKGKSLFLIYVSLLFLSWNGNASAAESDNEEYNFNWLDPDKKIYVLQNRKYLKGGHAEVSLLAGMGFSNPYRNTYNLDPRVTYYINETWGIELFYTLTSNSTNNTIKALSITSPQAAPVIREIRAQMGGTIHFVPWYAKINVFNSILYFDWYFAGGVGQLQTFVNSQNSFVQDNLTGFFLGTGHIYHLSQSFVFRIDLTDAIYQARIQGLTGDTAWYSNLNLGVGLGWRF